MNGVEGALKTSLTDENDKSDNSPILKVAELVKTYPARGIGRNRTNEVKAIDNVSFEVRPGETLAVVGESGSGKSTIANSVLGLQDVTSGDIIFEGTELTSLSRRQMRSVRRRLQVVFQDPFASLNARMRIGDIVAEPIILHRPGTSKEERRAMVEEMLQLVGLGHIDPRRFPYQLSGGQQQRVGIARSLIVTPQLVVCDEAVSALDVSVQAQVLDLLGDLKERFNLSYLFITHDLAVVRQIADRVLVLYQGRVVETGTTESVLDDPQQEYTKRLIAAVPGQRAEKERLSRQSDPV